MLFSIVIPIYQVEEYLERCVASVREQTYSFIEIILVDDGSPDKCPEMCDQYAQADSRIKVIHKKNGGLSDARNVGLKEASGTYVVFLDSDDYIERDFLEKISVLAKKEYDVLVGKCVVKGGPAMRHCELPNNYVCTGSDYLKDALRQKGAPMAAWLNVYRTEFLRENGLFFKEGILHEDEQFTPRVFLAAQTVCVTGVVFYNYIIRSGSITMQKDLRRNAKDLFETCCEHEVRYKQIKDNELRKLLLNTLAEKYLNMTQVGKLYLYGKEYMHKGFILRNAKDIKTKLKALLFAVSPWLYYQINAWTKQKCKDITQ